MNEGPFGTPPDGGALPRRLREALRGGSSPVRPVLSPERRAALVGALALAVTAFGIALRGMRPDLQELGPWNGLETGLRVALGLALIWMAMRAGEPGAGPPTAWLRAGLIAGPLVLLALIEWWVPVDGHAPFGSESAAWRQGLFGCWPAETALALPAALASGLLLARAYPLRPVFAGAAGALGASFLADAAMHLTCPARVWTHTALVHGGAVAFVTALGALGGWVIGRRLQGKIA